MKSKGITIADHVANGEGWRYATITRHRGGDVTFTYFQTIKGVIHIRERDGKVKGVSWINEANVSPTCILSADSWLDIALEVLTGERQ